MKKKILIPVGMAALFLCASWQAAETPDFYTFLPPRHNNSIHTPLPRRRVFFMDKTK